MDREVKIGIVVAVLFVVSTTMLTLAASKTVSKSKTINQKSKSTTTSSKKIVPKVTAKNPAKSATLNAPTQSVSKTINPYLGIPCSSNPKISFTHDLTDHTLINRVTPPSITDTTNRDRAFLWIDQGKAEKVPIYLPIEADLVNGIYKHSKDTLYDYDLVFQISCEWWFFINHIHYPIDSITSLLPSTPAETTANKPTFNPPIHFKAGDLLGYTDGTTDAHNFDFGVFDWIQELRTIPSTMPAGTADERTKHFVCSIAQLPAQIAADYLSKIDRSIAGSVCN